MFCLNHQYHCVAIKNEHLYNIGVERRTHFFHLSKKFIRLVFIHRWCGVWIFCCCCRFCCCCWSLNFRFDRTSFSSSQKGLQSFTLLLLHWCLYSRRWFVLLLCFCSTFSYSPFNLFTYGYTFATLCANKTERAHWKVFWFFFLLFFGFPKGGTWHCS